MKILSIEPTPSPNTMKLNMDESLPAGEARNYKEKDKNEAPNYVQKLLMIEGVKGLYHVADFIALERNGKVDWKTILPFAREVFGEVQADTDDAKGPQAVTESFGAVTVFIQRFRNIPMQIKLSDDNEEKRIGLPERFTNAAMKASEASSNMLMERKWVEEGARYGNTDEIGETVAEEVNAAYDDKRLEQLISFAFEQGKEGDQPVKKAAPKITEEMLNDEDWKKRYAALDQMDPALEDLPVLEKALADPKMSIRRLAVVYLGLIEKPEVLPYLYQALEDKSVTVRRTAGDSLSDLGDQDAIGPMIALLQDPSRIVRWRAAMFLYEVGDESALPALRETQDDYEFEVSLQVKLALERIEKGKTAKGSIWKQMTQARSKG